jgi:hypothetical protein
MSTERSSTGWSVICGILSVCPQVWAAESRWQGPPNRGEQRQGANARGGTSTSKKTARERGCRTPPR